MTTVISARIGRQPNPAERGFQLAHERPEVLEHLAQNCFLARASGAPKRASWEELTEEEREFWRIETLRAIAQHVAEYVGSSSTDNDPDPGGGEPVPGGNWDHHEQHRAARNVA